MTSSLPPELLEVFERSLTTEYVTIDRWGQPMAWPVTPYYHARTGCLDVSTRLGYPKKADDAAHNPHVALLFSDPTGSGLTNPPMVLVQGTADVDDRDLVANRERYRRESAAKLRGAAELAPPEVLRRFFAFYYTRIYIHVRPERIYAWPHGDLDAEPRLYGAHMEEVRSGHSEEPETGHAPPEGGTEVWHPRLDQLGRDYPTAALAVVAPDGFPFAVRVPVRADARARVVRIDADPVGAPLEPGLACLCAHAHGTPFTWQRNFQVRGDLTEEHGRWVLHPHRVVVGFELPPGSPVQRYRLNARKLLRYSREARRQRRLRAPTGR